MGLTNFEHIDRFVEANRRTYQAYRAALADVPGISLLTYDAAEHNNYQYIIAEIDPTLKVTRDQIVEALHAENVLARRYFWPGCHKMQPYRSLFPLAGETLAATEAIADRVIALPAGYSAGPDEIATIVAVASALTGATVS